jgi:hypothetical protein
MGILDLLRFGQRRLEIDL